MTLVPPHSKERKSWADGKQSAGERAVSGNAIIPPGARPDPVGPLDVVRGNWSDAEPRVLLLGTVPAAAVAPGPFPPGTVPTEAGTGGGASFNAGVRAVNFTGEENDTLCCACVLEYGHGASTSRVYFDWKAGAYNLPPCSYVNVQALPWGSSWGVPGVGPAAMAAAVVPGQMQGAHVPTVTGFGSFSAGDASPHNYLPVDHARAFDIEPANDAVLAVAPVVKMTGLAYAVRDFSGAYTPGWGPIAVSSGFQLHIKQTAGTDFVARLRWYLSL